MGDAKGLQPSKPGDHAMVANVQFGMSGWVWTSPGGRVYGPPLTNQVWAAINMLLRARGPRLKSASTRLRLHVTGGSGKTPAELEADAVDGIAVFPNIFFETPPNYVPHVTGDGLEPARIPIY